MANYRSDSVTNLATTFSEYLRRETPSCFADLDQAQVQIEFVGERMRPASIIYRYLVGDGLNQKHVLIKVPLKREKPASTPIDDQSNHVWRPNLVSMTDFNVKFQLEFEALSLIQSHFQKLDDARFDVIRVLDFLPDYRAIVMEESKNPSLRDLFKKTSRVHFGRASRELGTAFRNAGAWLSTYHRLPVGNHVDTRRMQRADIVKALQEFADYLTRTIDDRPFFERVTACATTTMDEMFKDTLPLGLGHGDYAMRNILVGPGERVSVFDTLAKWQTPIYEDIAYFLVGLILTWPQAISQGMLFSQVKLANYESEFLQGYFGQNPIPLMKIRLYQLLMLLDKWSFLISHTERAGSSVKGRTRLALLNRYYRQCAQQLLQAVDGSAVH